MLRSKTPVPFFSLALAFSIVMLTACNGEEKKAEETKVTTDTQVVVKKDSLPPLKKDSNSTTAPEGIKQPQ